MFHDVGQPTDEKVGLGIWIGGILFKRDCELTDYLILQDLIQFSFSCSFPSNHPKWRSPLLSATIHELWILKMHKKWNGDQNFTIWKCYVPQATWHKSTGPSCVKQYLIGRNGPMMKDLQLNGETTKVLWHIKFNRH